MPSSLLSPLADSHNSLLLLSLPDAFDQMLKTLRTLSGLARRSTEANDALRDSIFTAWQVLMELPTCQRQSDLFLEILTGTDRAAWQRLLPVDDPFLLLYNLLLIDRQLSNVQHHRGSAVKAVCVKRGLVEFLSTLAFDQQRGIAWLSDDRQALEEWGLQALSYALLLLTKLKTQEAKSEPLSEKAPAVPTEPARCVTPPPSRPDEDPSSDKAAVKRRRRSLHEVRASKEARSLQLRPRSSSDHSEAPNGLVISIPSGSSPAANAANNNFSDISSTSSGTSESGVFRLFNIPAIDCKDERGHIGSHAMVVRRLMNIIENVVSKK